MEISDRNFLIKLLETPSPSGYEQPIQEVVRQRLAGITQDVSTDVHGNVIGAINPSAALRIMLAGHCDQIGLLIQYIDAEGYISVQPIGGWDPMQLIGMRVTIWTAGGRCAWSHVAKTDSPSYRRGTQSRSENEGPLD